MARTLKGEAPQPVDADPDIVAVFTEPEVIYIGPPPEVLAERDTEYETLGYPLNDFGKGIIKDLKEGFVSFTKEKGSGRIVAACAVGRGVIDFSHTLVIAIRKGMTHEEFYQVPHYHPTMVEAWTYPED